MTRSQAAKTNGALSRGPKTEAGKAVSSRNAISHGLNARDIVREGEDPRAFDILLQNICIDHQPATVREHDLAFQMAASRWRLRRLLFMEKAAIDVEFRRLAETSPDLSPDDVSALAWTAAANSPAMKQVHRYETRLQRSCDKARAELDALVATRQDIEAETGVNHPCTLGLVEFEDAEVAIGSSDDSRTEPAAEAVQNEPDTTADEPSGSHIAPAPEDEAHPAPSAASPVPIRPAVPPQPVPDEPDRSRRNAARAA